MLPIRKFRTAKARKRAQLRLLIVSAVAITAVLLLVSGLVLLVKHPNTRIQTITIGGIESLDEASVQQVLQGSLDRTWLGVLPRDTVFTLRTAKLEQLLEATYPRVAEARVSRIGLTVLAVQIIEREATALWCGDVVPPLAYTKNSADLEQEERWGTCYLMDEHSYIYAKAPTFTGDVFLRYYGSLTKAEPVGQVLLDEESFRHLGALTQRLQDNDLSVRALLLVDEEDMELYLDNGLRVLVERNTSPETVTGRVQAILGAPQTGDVTKIEYLDLRFGNKAYIKYVQINEPELEAPLAKSASSTGETQ